MPTALIADDEALLADSLAERLRQLWPDLQIVAIVRNGIEAIAELNRLQPDFAFLDIRMPGLTGLQVAKSVRDTQVIFVTAFDEYAISAFEACAMDYLLKPVSDARLAQCVGRLQRETRPPANWDALSKRLAAPQAQYLGWLNAGLADTTRLVAINEVIYFQSSEKYTEIITSHERHLIRTPLKELLPQLDPQRFAQIHRSYIVSLPMVARIERDLLGRLRLYLKDREEALPLSRTFAPQFKQM